MSQYRGSVALVLAFTLGIVLIVITVAIALGVHVTEMTRTAAVGAVGILVGALAAYLAKS
jgi:succinate-acetate transporter protein